MMSGAPPLDCSTLDCDSALLAPPHCAIVPRQPPGIARNSKGREPMSQHPHRRQFIQASAAIGAVAATGLSGRARAAAGPVLDDQVHAYERNHPGRPWAGTLVGPEEMTGDEMVSAMDAVGVDGAVLVSPFSMYR